jgi:AhpD family alkylhydroperoxidase
VAVGASIAANCIPCLRNHFGRALEAGLTLEQIRAAVAVGQAVKNAPSRHTSEAWQELLASKNSELTPEVKAACCS